MGILNRAVESVTFDDIIAFCNTGIPEGIQLDYKKILPKNIAKHLASFSNTRGGLLIIGVEENRTTGVPEKWEGVAFDAKQIEQIHQNAANVKPKPNYVVHTAKKDTKAFILVRVMEGEAPPYYIENDANIWVRTGNISNPISLGTPDWVELLFKKRDKADQLRKAKLERARKLYKYGLIKEDLERKALIEEAKHKGDESHKTYFQQNLGTNVIMSEVFLTPYYPSSPITTPRQLLDNLGNLTIDRLGQSFPNLNSKPIPEGIYYFSHNYRGYIECQAIYADGSMYNNMDVLEVSEEKRIIYISYLLGQVARVLLSSKKLYELYGYQGILYLNIYIKDLSKVSFRQIDLNGFFLRNDVTPLFPEYEWSAELDTSQLFNSDTLKSFLYEFMQDLYWRFGYRNFERTLFDKFLEKNNIKI